MRRFLYWLLLLTLLVLVAAFFTPGPFRAALGGAGLPFLKGTTAASNAVANHLENLRPTTRAERERLRHYERLILQLNTQLQQARLAAAENRELRQYLEMPAPPAWRLAVAPVIARDPYTWNRRFRIGKGALHGITLGAAVLAGNQVIGRIHELSARSAVVATLADPACKLSVHLPGSNAVGILAGRADQHWHEPPFCLVTFLPRDADYQPGDYVLTSGLGDAVPAGLPVGRVMPFPDGASKRIASAAYAELLVRPGADFAGFRDVAVLVPLPPPAPHSPGPP